VAPPRETNDEAANAPPAAPDRAPRSVAFLLSQLGFVSSKRFFDALAPLGIQPREFLLLRMLSAAEGQSQQALAERLHVPPSRMVALVDGLEQKGLVERRPDPGDRRVRALHLTAKGGRLLAKAVAAATKYDSDLCSNLTAKENEQLVDLLQKLQAGKVDLRGVHPGLATEHSEPPEG
jgi:DNA-binding MarR family transcriptional regulator